MGRINPPQLLIISFLCVIFAGAVLLLLPAATQGDGNLSLVDSLFTATSATCVTGLIVKDTGSFFTPFGRWVIFALFQMGGLGIMTFSTLFAVMLGRKLGFNESDVISTTLDRRNIIGFKKLLAYIVGITVSLELIGAGFLFLRWKVISDWSIAELITQSVFHSVSAFCNAGFSLFSDSLIGFSRDPYIVCTMMGLIFLGGIGFIVIMDMLNVFVTRKHKKKVSFQTRIVIFTSIALVFAGAVLIFLFEKDLVMSGISWGEKILNSFFQSVTARTAGFNTVPIKNLSVPTLLIIILLMFIGASPGSTGGGIKTCTFAVLLAMVASFLKNNKKVKLLNRSIPKQVIRETIVIIFLAASWVFVFSLLTAFFNGAAPKDFLKYLFEVVSAFGTVGLSAGATQELNTAGKICIILTMFAGRVGPLTLALAIAFREKQDKYMYPEETIMVG